MLLPVVSSNGDVIVQFLFPICALKTCDFIYKIFIYKYITTAASVSFFLLISAFIQSPNVLTATSNRRRFRRASRASTSLQHQPRDRRARKRSCARSARSSLYHFILKKREINFKYAILWSVKTRSYQKGD